ncbi:MAG: DUF2857 family protein [Hydrogenophilales bacterium]|nr:DUF2857 family protein [Hydrogenophilales bacterium]
MNARTADPHTAERQSPEGTAGRLPGIPIGDGRQVLALLQHVADRADQGQDLDILLSQLSPSTLDALRRLPITDLLRLAQQRPPFCSVVFDEPMLKLAMHRLQIISQQQEQTLWFMRRGAPAAMMLELFGLHDLAYRRLRAVVKLDTRRGRTPKLDTQTYNEVIRQWQRTRGLGNDMAARFRILAERFPEAPIAALWAATRGAGQ